MSDRDTITLPREVVQLALEAFEAVMPFSTTQRVLKIRAVEALRTALAAEQPVPTDKDSLTVQSRLDAESFREERDEARALLNGVLQDIEALRRENERLREALESIAANACCDRCQEAALVAKAALRREET